MSILPRRPGNAASYQTSDRYTIVTCLAKDKPNIPELGPTCPICPGCLSFCRSALTIDTWHALEAPRCIQLLYISLSLSLSTSLSLSLSPFPLYFLEYHKDSTSWGQLDFWVSFLALWIQSLRSPEATLSVEISYGAKLFKWRPWLPA